MHYGEDWIRGSERCLLDWLGHLDRDRVRPVVWCNSQTMATAVAELHVPVVRGRFPILLDWQPPRFDLVGFAARVREGVALVRAHEIELIHANSAAPNQWMLPVARTTGVPLIAHLHTSYDLRGRCVFGLHHSDVVIGVSRIMVRDLLADGVPHDRVRVVYNGIDRERLDQGDAKGLREELGIGDDEVVLSCVGSLIRRKGFDVLLDAFARVHAAAPRTRLLVIGDGPEREALLDQTRALGLARSVHFLGVRMDAGAILRDAVDVSVSASRDEGLALSLMEAFAFGRPVVATDVGGTAEALEDGVAGYLVPAEDAATLADRVLRLVQDPALRARFGAAARARAEGELSVRSTVRALHGLYDELVQRPRRPRSTAARLRALLPWARLARRIVGARLGVAQS